MSRRHNLGRSERVDATRVEGAHTPWGAVGGRGSGGVAAEELVPLLQEAVLPSEAVHLHLHLHQQPVLLTDHLLHAQHPMGQRSVRVGSKVKSIDTKVTAVLLTRIEVPTSPSVASCECHRPSPSTAPRSPAASQHSGACPS